MNLSLTLFVYASHPICTQSIAYLLVTLTCRIQNLERNGHMTFDLWLYLPYGKKKYKKNTLLHWLVISSIRTEIQREQKEDFFFISVRVSEGKSTLRKLFSWAPIYTRYQWKYPTVCTTFKRRMWLKTVSCREAVVSCYILFMACFLVQSFTF